MLKKLTGAVLLALGCTAAYAETGWIVVEGLYDSNAGVEVPNWRLYGKFVGTDLDNDGVIRTNELDSLKFDTTQWANCNWTQTCILDFSYSKADGALNINGYVRNGDPEYINYSTYNLKTGSYYSRTYYSGNNSESTRLEWTDHTTVTVSPVPEPATVSMMLVGLAGTVVALRRRRR